MNKAEFINAISEESNFSKKDVANMFETMTKVITDTLKANDKITLAGFGTFEIRRRAAREGRNPHTGETINIAAKRVPAFKASGKLKESIQ